MSTQTRKRSVADATGAGTRAVGWGEEMHRATLRMTVSEHERATLWAQREGLSFNEFVLEAVEEKILRINGVQVGEGTLLINRLNQLIDVIKSLDTSQRNLEQVVVGGFDSLLRMARGDSYLMDPVDPDGGPTSFPDGVPGDSR